MAAVLDFVLSWKARRSMSLAVKLRYVLKLISAAAWVVILPVTYAYSWENPSGLSRMIKSWLGNGQSQQSLYILAVVVYLSPNILASVLFLFPFIRRFLEKTDLSIIAFMMWWAQVILSDICELVNILHL
jgi:callose synthase